MKKIFLGIIVIIVLGVGWYLLSPLFIDTTVNEAFPGIEGENPSMINDSDTSEQVTAEDIIVGADIEVSESMDDMSANMTTVTTGSFVGADSLHKGSGELKVIIDGDKQFLRFEDFSVTNGPDLYVTLNKKSNPTSDNFGEHVLVERLKGNKGSQNYDVSDIDLSEYASVSIYCRAFSTLFATASL